LEKVTPLQFGLTLVLLLGFWVLLRAFRTKGQHKLALESELPLSEFTQLLSRLEAHGIHRASSETLHVFRERIQATERLSASKRQRICGLLDEYGQLRYGRRRDDSRLKEDLVELVQSL
jgi:hypothetical protein